MLTGFNSCEFSRAFSKLLQKAGASCYQISQYSHLDQAYLSRLRSGERCSPSPETVLKICLAVVHCSERVSLFDVDEFFNSAGIFLFERNPSHGSGAKLVQKATLKPRESDLK